MSFLSGIISAGKSAISFLRGNSIASTLLKTAAIGYAMSRLSKSINRENNSGTQNIDKGVRLQLKPSAENKIPVLYGRAFFGGDITDAAMTNNNKTMWYCLTLSEKTGTRLSDSSVSTYTFHDVYLNQQRIVFQADGITVDYTVDREGTIDRNASGLIKIYFYAGGRTAGTSPSGYSASVPNAETLFPNWTAGANAMSNLIFALVRVDYNREKNITGLPDMLFEIENDTKLPGDVVYDYLTSTVYGAGIRDADIDNASLTTLNTYSDSTFGYIEEDSTAQTLADRYQINGLIDTNEKVIKNAEQILSAAASWLSYDVHTGTWSAVINRAGSSVASFTDDNVLGSVAVSGTGLQDLYNAVQVNFPHRELRDSADFIKIEIPDGDRNANEEDNTLNLTYDNINEPVQAELLGFIELKQSRVDLVVRFETDYSYINLNAGDIIDLTNSRLGFSAKLFRIIAITEKQGNDGALTLDITALEYDANVYDTGDITRYTRTDEDGIITLGAIGTPGTPQITKYEQASRPRIEVETTAPTGVVEGLEFWITFDDEEPTDANRSYTLVGTKKPVGGGVYTSGSTVVFEYDNLSASNFYFKVRGFNTNTVGPYSSPSGLVEFEPEQVPDAITPDTAVKDATGTLATLLSITELLKLLDGLLSSDTSAGGLFKKIFDIFKTETGVDLEEEASTGGLTQSVPAQISIKDEGTVLTAEASSLNFVGSGVVARNDGTSCTIYIPPTEAPQPPTPVEPDPTDPTVPTNTVINIVSTLPPDRATHKITLEKSDADKAPTTGSYYITMPAGVGAYQRGSGDKTCKLWKSDGTLVETLAPTDANINNNIIELPFANRTLNTDYYITVDQGFIVYCTADIEPVDQYEWNFNTPAQAVSAYTAPSPTVIEVSNQILATVSIGACAMNTLTIGVQNEDSTADIYFLELRAGSGNILIKSGGSTVATINASVFADSSQLTYARSCSYTIPTTLSYDTEYTVEIPTGALIVKQGDFCTNQLKNVAGDTLTLAAVPDPRGTWGFIKFDAQSIQDAIGTGTYELDDPTDLNNVDRQSLLIFRFTSANSIIGVSTNTTFTIKKGATTVQVIDTSETYADDNVSELIWLSGNNVYLNPTVDFEPGETYSVEVPSGAVIFYNGCEYENWSGGTFNFRVYPGLNVQSITNDGTNVDITMSNTVEKGSGDIIIRAGDSSVITTVNIDDVEII